MRRSAIDERKNVSGREVKVAKFARGPGGGWPIRQGFQKRRGRRILRKHLSLFPEMTEKEMKVQKRQLSPFKNTSLTVPRAQHEIFLPIGHGSRASSSTSITLKHDTHPSAYADGDYSSIQYIIFSACSVPAPLGTNLNVISSAVSSWLPVSWALPTQNPCIILPQYP